MRWILVRRTVWEWRQVPGLKLGAPVVIGAVAFVHIFHLWSALGNVALGLAETALMVAGFAALAILAGKGVRRGWSGRRNRPSDMPAGVTFHLLANPTGKCDVSICRASGIAIADKPGVGSVLLCHEHSAQAHYVLTTRGSR